MTRKTRDSGTFGTAHKLPSGRYRAMYYGPDGRRYTAPTTFTSKAEARGLAGAAPGRHHPQGVGAAGGHHRRPSRLTFGQYAEQWMAHRELKARTREHYRWLLDEHLIPGVRLHAAELDHRRRRARLARQVRHRHPHLRAHCYGLLRTILATAASDGKITVNPCVIRGAGTTKRVHQIRPATLPELEKLTQAMPERSRR